MLKSPLWFRFFVGSKFGGCATYVIHVDLRDVELGNVQFLGAEVFAADEVSPFGLVDSEMTGFDEDKVGREKKRCVVFRYKAHLLKEGVVVIS